MSFSIIDKRHLRLQSMIYIRIICFHFYRLICMHNKPNRGFVVKQIILESIYMLNATLVKSRQPKKVLL